MPSSNPEATPDVIPVKFQFYELKFTPYVSLKDENTQSIIHQVITFLSQEQQKGRGILIDRHEMRDHNTARPLFVTQAVFMLREKRIRVSMALLRTGRIPLVKPSDKFLLIPMDTSKGEIAEQTHFFIDYSTDRIIFCVEFNYHGPRISDIEFYLRVIARDKLNLARATELTFFIDTSIDKTLADLRNVLNFEIRFNLKNFHN